MDHAQTMDRAQSDIIEVSLIESENDAMETKNTSQTGHGGFSKTRTIAISFVGGVALGIVVTGVAVWLLMPGMMIVSKESRLGFDETVSAIDKAIADHGWISPGTTDMQRSLVKHGNDFPYRVTIIKLCHPQYANDVLTTDRYVACLMPCSIAVWEGDDGRVYISKMNTGLMGKMFGGNIAKVMGQQVSRDEQAILASVLKG